jgi:hypothetical protein
MRPLLKYGVKMLTTTLSFVNTGPSGESGFSHLHAQCYKIKSTVPVIRKNGTVQDTSVLLIV